MRTEKLVISDPVQGFTERDRNSKAILNTDMDALLKYKIQKKKFSEINKTGNEINNMRCEIENIKSDLGEIKQLLLQITQK